jgi:hypothetical protein
MARNMSQLEDLVADHNRKVVARRGRLLISSSQNDQCILLQQGYHLPVVFE